MDYKDYIEQKKQQWIGKVVWYDGKAYKVVDVDHNGAIMLDKTSQFSDTTAVPEADVKPLTEKEYYETGKPFKWRFGFEYENLNGTKYVCVSRFPCNHPIVQSARAILMGGDWKVWECVVHGVRMYEDGRIDWGHSTDGSFEAAVD